MDVWKARLAKVPKVVTVGMLFLFGCTVVHVIKHPGWDIVGMLMFGLFSLLIIGWMARLGDPLAARVIRWVSPPGMADDPAPIERVRCEVCDAEIEKILNGL